MSKRILVINPNSNTVVTRAMSDALDHLRFADGPVIDCVTLEDGPPGIETDQHVALASRMVPDRIASCTADAYVIACFCDPGLAAARETSRAPVFGIAQCGYATAMTRGKKFVVISILEQSICRHRRQLESMGILSSLAADIPIGIGVAELDQEERVATAMSQAAGELKERHGADVVIMGCAGMARYRKRLETAVGVTIVDPVQAAVAMALNAVGPRDPVC